MPSHHTIAPAPGPTFCSILQTSPPTSTNRSEHQVFAGRIPVFTGSATRSVSHSAFHVQPLDGLRAGGLAAVQSHLLRSGPSSQPSSSAPLSCRCRQLVPQPSITATVSRTARPLPNGFQLVTVPLKQQRGSQSQSPACSGPAAARTQEYIASIRMCFSVLKIH